jgi:hypothetical protein
MSKYVLAFHGQPERTSGTDEEAAWSQWFGSLGEKVVDFGNRVEHVQTLVANGHAPSSSRELTGYVVVDAADDKTAAELARGCPGLASGVDVEIAKTIAM